MLDFSKIEQQEFKLHIQEFDLVLLLKEVFTLLDGKAEAKEIGFEFEIKQEQFFIQGDFDRLKQVFINLIGNAILYTPPKGQVKVSLFDHEEKARIHVKDSRGWDKKRRDSSYL